MDKQIAVVTGASRGIGLAIAKMLLGKGYTVCGLCRRPGPLAEVQWISCDVTDDGAVQRAFSEIYQRFGNVDLLVNNAGMGISGAIEFSPETEIRRQLDVNLFGAIRCTQQVLGPMRERKHGKIIFTSSLAAIFPLPFQSFYSVSKAGLDSFSDALGIEMKPFGVSCCSILLNDVKTDFTDSRRKTVVGDEIYGGRISQSVGKMEASERSGMSPEQVADTVGKILERKHLPPHKIVGGGNEVLGLLYRLLPARTLLWLLGKLYG